MAADITVDDACTLADAIAAANRDEAVGGCNAGDGADVISLSADVVLEAELPRITTEIKVAGGGYSISGAQAYRIFYVETSGTLTIERLTLREGRAGTEISPDHWDEDGGAVYNDGELSIKWSIFVDNAAAWGGAIANRARLSVVKSTFVENSGFAGGGAVFNFENSKLNVSASEFTSNSGALGGAIGILNGELSFVSSSSFADNTASWGGAISSQGASHVYNSTFDANTAQDGGAILSSGTLRVVDSVFTFNGAVKEGGAILNNGMLIVRESTFAENRADLGGAIDNSEDATLSVDDSIFNENLAWIYGGAIRNEGSLRISDSAFSGNSAVDFYEFHDLPKPEPRKYYYSGARLGGAIASFKSLRVLNSVFYENSADGGAVILIGEAINSAVDADLTHLTLVRNSADHGGGLVVTSAPDTKVYLHNSLFAGNTGGDCFGALVKSRGNLIEDGSCNTDFSGDPMLGDLVEPEDGSPAYYPLLPGSPAIDAASSEYCPDSDQIGTARPQGDACDIGAIEFVPEQ